MSLQFFSLPITELPYGLLAHATILIIALAIAAVLLWKWPACMGWGVAWLGRVARHRARSVLLVGMVAWLGSGLAVIAGGLPQPSLHDEFSNLVAADTFTSGRLTNPTHPLWRHFETIHVLSKPSRQSKYPPAQGLLLAAGQVLGKQPYLAVWLATGLASMAVYWMLLAWLPSRWALAGGLIAACHAGITLHWGTNFAGGQLATIGGALVYGGVGRFLAAPGYRSGLAMGLGLALLANSRPAEGLLVSLPAAVLVLVCAFRRDRDIRQLAGVGAGVAGIMIPCFGLMGYYNGRVTGRMLTMPYQEHSRQYMAAPIFFWQAEPALPEYQNREISDFYAVWEYGQYAHQKTLAGYTKGRLKRFLWIVLFYCPPALMLSWLGLPRAFSQRRVRWVPAVLLFIGFCLLAWVWLWPHYLAPAACLIMLLLTSGLRGLYPLRLRGRMVGRWLVGGAVLAHVAVSVVVVWQLAVADRSGWSGDRARILAALHALPGKDLVLVAYRPNHNLHHEWVYNRADIDAADVVWARVLDGANNRQLLEYYADRRLWYLDADAARPRVVAMDEVQRTQLCNAPAGKGLSNAWSHDAGVHLAPRPAGDCRKP